MVTRGPFPIQRQQQWESSSCECANDEVLEAEIDSSFELFCEDDELVDEYIYDYDDYVDESM